MNLEECWQIFATNPNRIVRGTGEDGKFSSTDIVRIERFLSEIRTEFASLHISMSRLARINLGTEIFWDFRLSQIKKNLIKFESAISDKRYHEAHTAEVWLQVYRQMTEIFLEPNPKA